MKENAALVKEGEGYVDKGIDWLENEAKSGVKAVADEAKGIPVVEQVAKGAETLQAGRFFEAHALACQGRFHFLQTVAGRSARRLIGNQRNQDRLGKPDSLNWKS